MSTIITQGLNSTLLLSQGYASSAVVADTLHSYKIEQALPRYHIEQVKPRYHLEKA